jgi:hypothetical protein
LCGANKAITSSPAPHGAILRLIYTLRSCSRDPIPHTSHPRRHHHSASRYRVNGNVITIAVHAAQSHARKHWTKCRDSWRRGIRSADRCCMGCASGMVSFAHRIAQLHMFDAGGRELGGAEKAPVFVCWARGERLLLGSFVVLLRCLTFWDEFGKLSVSR